MRNDYARVRDTILVCVTGICPLVEEHRAIVLVDVDDDEGCGEGNRDGETYFYKCRTREGG